jgi:hypothetical protein
MSTTKKRAPRKRVKKPTNEPAKRMEAPAQAPPESSAPEKDQPPQLPAKASEGTGEGSKPADSGPSKEKAPVAPSAAGSDLPTAGPDACSKCRRPRSLDGGFRVRLDGQDICVGCFLRIAAERLRATQHPDAALVMLCKVAEAIGDADVLLMLQSILGDREVARLRARDPKAADELEAKLRRQVK